MHLGGERLGAYQSMMGFGQLMGVEPEEDATIGPRVTRGSRFCR
jgi:hypothetical protein